ncbi:Hypp5906 [Branchiostoma lanceolatum]|uniref:Hypp5906 protein n=1 Tax=Branchiostoma lanceolatum TaxID=7740 RepID=A0A8J9VGK8_BRALA|nr:Hypp5906 [Branchiostoma lanceolatum]
MGKRRSAQRKPIWRRSILETEELRTDTVITKTEPTRTGSKIEAAPTISRGYEISKVNMTLLPGQSARVPIHFVVLLAVFLLSAFLIFCRGSRSKSAGSKSSKAAHSRRSSAATSTSNTASRAVRKVSSDKGRNSLEKIDVSNDKKTVKRNVSNGSSKKIV